MFDTDHGKDAAAYGELLTNSYTVLHTAQNAVTRFALLHAAHLVLAEHPEATHLIIDPSDQGDHMAPYEIILTGGEVIDEFDELNDELWRPVSDMRWDDPAWMAFGDTEFDLRRDHVALDLHKIIDERGDFTRLLPKGD